MPDATIIIDVQDGETEDAARERHELATARAAIAHVDRVLENGRARAEFERLRAEVDCGQEGVCAKPPGCAKHWQERNQELVAERDELVAERDAALAEGLQDQLPSAVRRPVGRWGALARAAIAQADRVLENGRLAARANGYREAARRLRGVVAASLEMLRLRFPCTDALTGSLPDLIDHAARDVELSEQYHKCAVARTKELETALERAWIDVLYLRDVHRRVDAATFTGLCQATMGRIELALHPPPPASASDRTGTEHHDAAEPEDGCQAGERRP